MPENTIIDEKVLAKDNGEMSDDLEVADFENPANVSEETLLEMIKAGLWYGRGRAKTHPKMRQYIFTQRNNIEIIDLVKTAAALETALTFLKEVAKKNGQILFVGTHPAAKHQIEAIAKKFKQPYVVNRWLGGILTNFTTLSKRVDYFKKLKADKASGALGKYTKKEQSGFGKEIARLHTFFSGIEDMTKLPDAVFVVGVGIHFTPVHEANRMKIPVVGLISTDTDPTPTNYPIPANDSSAISVHWILNEVEKAIEAGIAERAAAVVEKKEVKSEILKT